MRVVLATGMRIPHTGGASTHFELLTLALDRTGMLAGRVIGQDGELSRLQRALCALRLFGGSDARRGELLRATARLLTRSIDCCVATVSPDLLHCHDALSAHAAINSAEVRARRLPIVQTVHGPWSREILTSGVIEASYYYRQARLFEQDAYANCTRLITVDQGQADILIDDFRVSSDKVSVVHNAVDYAEISALALGTSDVSLSAPYFIVPRRLVAKNGVHVAIEAMNLLQDGSAHLVIAGDGPLEASLRDRAESLAVSSRVTFLGSLPRERLMPLMAQSAGVIVPSVPCKGVIEATSLAVIESFACGVPVIASDIGGLAELIRHGDTGLLVPPGDAHDLAAACLRVLRMSEPERSRLCAAAREAALQRWDVEPWLARIIQSYSRALSLRGPL